MKTNNIIFLIFISLILLPTASAYLIENSNIVPNLNRSGASYVRIEAFTDPYTNINHAIQNQYVAPTASYLNYEWDNSTPWGYNTSAFENFLGISPAYSHSIRTYTNTSGVLVAVLGTGF